MTRDGVRRVLRTYLFAFLGTVLPGLLGWLNALTEWARAEGQRPFPDATSLAYLGVAAITAGFIALVNAIVIGLEDATGRGFLRTPPVRPTPDTRGAVSLTTAVIAVAAVVVLVAVVLLL